MIAVIKNIRWRMKSETRSVIDFDFQGKKVTIAEPYDVILDDNEPSKKWIALHYGFLLAFLMD